jgi:selenocysteine-specific translation elongation factor
MTMLELIYWSVVVVFALTWLYAFVWHPFAGQIAAFLRRWSPWHLSVALSHVNAECDELTKRADFWYNRCNEKQREDEGVLKVMRVAIDTQHALIVKLQKQLYTLKKKSSSTGSSRARKRLVVAANAYLKNKKGTK